MYSVPTNTFTLDLYTVDSTVRKNSVPFVHGVELEGPNGEIVRIRSVFDDGAMVNAIDKKLHTKIKERLTMAKPSSKVLRMADGRLVPSAGIWEGGVTVAGVKNQGRFEIFDSGGAWGLLFGKPLLQAFKAQHDYEKDTIRVRQTDGMEAILKNQYRVLPATHPPGSLIGLTTDIKQTISLEGDQCLSPSGIDDPSEGADTSEEASSRVASDTQEVEEGANNGQRGNSEPARTNSVGESRSPSREVLNETQPVHLANVVDTLVTTDIPDNIWIVCEDGTGVNDDPGTEQPVMPTKLSPSVLTRASDPFNTKRVDAVMKEITIGPDVVGEEREAVVQLLREHADCFALSLSEVTPVKGAVHKLNIPEGTKFNTRIGQRRLTSPQKEYYNGVLDKMLEAGIVRPIDHKDVKCCGATTLATKRIKGAGSQLKSSNIASMMSVLQRDYQTSDMRIYHLDLRRE
ncbi:hypothetical protein BD779DRAFT_1680441 [Infundibulicybe gibba]|nr:hypothetical protein BD779DRAFT_1680441 [Infundibulicybe gibba]